MNDKEILLEQYKKYVETTDKVSTLRSTANNFFITINTALIALFPFIVDEAKNASAREQMITMVVSLGIVLNIIWFLTIRTYKALNSAKFEAIKQMEDQLPAQPFEVEWKKLKERKWFKKYLTLTGIEVWLPLAMIIPYATIYFMHPASPIDEHVAEVQVQETVATTTQETASTTSE